MTTDEASAFLEWESARAHTYQPDTGAVALLDIYGRPGGLVLMLWRDNRGHLGLTMCDVIGFRLGPCTIEIHEDFGPDDPDVMNQVSEAAKALLEQLK